MWWARLLNNLISLYTGGAAPTSYESIATVTVGAGGSSSITFSSIPSTYKHLQIRVTNLGSNNVNNILMNINSDNGANYSWHELYGDGASVTANAGASQTFLKVGFTNVNTTSYTSAGIIDILDYANTSKYKTVRALNGSDSNGSGYMIFRSGLWLNTNAITTLVFTGQGGSTFNQYSSFALYGVKG